MREYGRRQTDTAKGAEEWVDPERNDQLSVRELRQQLRFEHQKILLETGLAQQAHKRAASWNQWRNIPNSPEDCIYDVVVLLPKEGKEDETPYDEAINIVVKWEGGAALGDPNQTVWCYEDAPSRPFDPNMPPEDMALLEVLADEVRRLAEEPGHFADVPGYTLAS